MKQLFTVLGFEYKTYLKKKSFIGITIVMILAAVISLSIPRISSLFSSGRGDQAQLSEQAQSSEQETAANQVAILDETGIYSSNIEIFQQVFASQNIKIEVTGESLQELEKQVDEGKLKAAFVITQPLVYQQIVKDKQMYDSFTSVFETTMLRLYRNSSFESLGVAQSEVQAILNAEIKGETITVGGGKDMMQNYFFTTIMTILLYMVIMLYGQFVASSVANEKSSRAMELLITSANTNSLMFGKVLGTGLAGLTQMGLILLSAVGAYRFNESYYADNFLIQSIFNTDIATVAFGIVYCILGFFVYAFIFAALASFVSRLEDVGVATQPVLFMFIIAYMMVIFSLSSGQVNSSLMVACSYIPFTSPMAMFARIAMVYVPVWQIALSVGILLATTILLGFAAAYLYRLGVLMYGTSPTPRQIFRVVKANKNSKKNTAS